MLASSNIVHHRADQRREAESDRSSASTGHKVHDLFFGDVAKTSPVWISIQQKVALRVGQKFWIFWRPRYNGYNIYIYTHEVGRKRFVLVELGMIPIGSLFQTWYWMHPTWDDGPNGLMVPISPNLRVTPPNAKDGPGNSDWVFDFFTLGAPVGST